MIAGYRRIPYCFSRNTRTLFCTTPQKSPDLQVSHWTEENRSYETVAKGNVRLLFITNPKCEYEEIAHCAIRVASGSYEDSEQYRGLSHLLEHLISHCAARENLRNQNCSTSPLYTNFAFDAEISTLTTEMEAWSKYLFSRTSFKGIRHDIREITKLEVEKVDNEFHEKRTKKLNLPRSFAILRSEGVALPKFAAGNKDTLGYIDFNHLMDEIEKHRERYRRRALAVCIYSQNQLAQDTRLDIWGSLIEFRVEEELTKPNILEHKRSSTAKLLFVTKSTDGALQLTLLFPFTKLLNSKEMQTMTFCCKMIKCKIENCLAHTLMNGQWGTVHHVGCGDFELHIVINLTADGLTNILHVSSIVRKYLKFLHNEWETLDNLKYRPIKKNLQKTPNLKHVIGLIRHPFFEGLDHDLYENNVKKYLPVEEEKQLIKEQLLDNKKIVHTIAARDTETVANVLKKLIPERPRDGFETNYGIKYSVYETQFLEHMSEVNTAFKLINLEPYVGEAPSQDGFSGIYTYITKPSHIAIQAVFVSHLKWKLAHIRAIYDCLGIESNVLVIPLLIAVRTKAQGIIDYIDNDWNTFQIPEDEFVLCKNRLMSELSIQMTNSKKLAKSLMGTAVGNAYYNDKKCLNPVPMQYNQLKTMKISDYRAFFQSVADKDETFKPDFDSSLNIRIDKQFLIPSMNRNELNTVTLAFFKVNKSVEDGGSAEEINHEFRRLVQLHLLEFRNRYHVYTAACTMKEFYSIEGILIKIISVENKDIQSGEKIIDFIKNKLLQQDATIMEAYNANFSCRIIIQIKGNNEATDDVHQFDEAFDVWFQKNKKIFKRLINIGKGKCSACNII